MTQRCLDGATDVHLPAMSNDHRYAMARQRPRAGVLAVGFFLLTGCASLIVSDMAKGGNPDYQSDLALAGSVERYLRADPVLGSFAIDASVYQGIATLSGRVSTPAQKQRAADLAYRVAGVKRVVSRVSYGPP